MKMPLFRRKSDKQNTKTPKSSAPTVNVSDGIKQKTPTRPFKLELTNGDLGNFTSLESPMRTSSRLSKTLTEILHDKDALGYFIQFMESKKAGQYIRFWLDAESFQASTWSRIRTHSFNLSRKNSMKRLNQSNTQLSDSKTTTIPEQSEEESLSVSSQNLQGDSELVDSQVKSGQRPITAITDSRLDQTAPPIHDTGQITDMTQNVLPNISDNVINQSKLSAVISHDNEQTGFSGFTMSKSSASSEDLSNTSNVTEKSEMSGQKQNKSGVKQDDSVSEKLKQSIERDAVTIFTKYISKDATIHSIHVSDQLRDETIRKICREDGEVDPSCFKECQDFVVVVMETEYYPEFIASPYLCKHNIDLLTSGKVYLADFLYNESALSYFIEYMDSEKAGELLQFWLATDNFQQHLSLQQSGQYDGRQAQDDAMVLYDKYFSLQATCPLGFDDKIRFEVESNICREEGPLPDCFSKPRDIVLNTMQNKYFSNFVHGDIYYRFLSELVSSVQTAEYPIKTHKRVDSDASSEHSSHSAGSESVASKNTLLAQDTSHLRRLATRLENDLNMDPALLNPDLLWKRPRAGKMSIGKIDKYGKFVSEFDPQPDPEKAKKGGSYGFFKKKDREKEEELALQVANMIINDVTSVTQAIGTMRHSPSPLSSPLLDEEDINNRSLNKSLQNLYQS